MKLARILSKRKFQSYLYGIEILVAILLNYHSRGWFQSYLYGIEIGFQLLRMHTLQGFNRTFMELKYCILEYSLVRLGSFNRTFMELKYLGSIDSPIQISEFQSYLYGIEISLSYK